MEAAVMTVGVGWSWVRPRGPQALPAPPGLLVSTTPAGATIFLNGKESGRTPQLLANLPPGAHSLRVVRDGFAPAELTVDTTGDGPPVPLRFTLWPLGAMFLVDSEPGEVAVEIDGKLAGTTPMDAVP